MFVHHVFFWLKPELNQEQQAAFEAGVKSLLGIQFVKIGDVGRPATTDRPVIERSYSYSLLLAFENLADHDAYQVDPTHLKFVETCQQYWDRVQIYDSETV
ncbi:transcription-repair coupling factor [Adhaeribacter arboris]|uniref:Transcription-repair coupling factor n=1 Tax=Adhaeribacter arboris TaxID=2072846 RepID=A0A2T2YG54_9BACT|nr:Dabb family protein [Adhaeribacter arboris]PSR54495.1 transcription-repair coupling factor [Adhaeribacter arboris]